MRIVIPHVGKSHLTRETVFSIPDEHQIILIDASYVADMDTLAANKPGQITYIRPDETPTCLARNWNIGAAAVPAEDEFWMFCASDIQFHKEAWPRIETALTNYPDAAIIKDAPTNWNAWIVRRWAWDILAPMDERYTPCGGEDDDLVMKCQAAGLKILEAVFRVNHLEGGHATRLDIRRDLAGTDWSGRHRNIRLFREKWGCIPSKGRDATYKAAIEETHIRERRAEPPSKGFTPPKLSPSVQKAPREWPDPLRLNLGAGPKRRHLDGFVNVDANERFEPDACLDLVNGSWPWEDGSVDRIESYHFLEHVDEAGGRKVVERAFKALRPGGVFVVECPDLNGICARYARSTRRMRRSLYGQQTDEWRFHRWGYCPATLTLLLREIGFSEIETGPGTDYHAKEEPCLRAVAVK